MLKGVSDALDENRRPKYLERFAATFVPYSGFWRSLNRSIEVEMGGDANARQVKSIGDAFMQNLPFGTLTLKPKMNIWGEEIVLDGGVLRQWLPFKYRSNKPDALEQELERIGLYPAIPDQKYNHYDEKKLKYVKMDIPDKIYEEARISYGNLLKKKLESVVDANKDKEPALVAFTYNKVIRGIRKTYIAELKREMQGTIDEYNKKNYPKDS